MFASATVSSRRVQPSYRPWAEVITKGQAEALDHLTQSYAGLLVADPGAGKTAITLAAFVALRNASTAPLRMLVVAPLRVCQLVWRQEGQTWSEFRELKFVFLHGPQKDNLLHQPHDIALINFEGLQWLTNKYFGKRLPWDIVCIDETTKVKHHNGARAKALRARLRHVKYRWGLTGSLVPNGYMDLFGQMLMLDDGAALGRRITHYRDMYFQQGFDGFTWKLRRGAAEQIEDRIRPYVYRLPYTELPPLDDIVHHVEMAPAERKKYEALKRDMVVQLEQRTITTANAGALYSKLKQLASGAVYTGSLRPDGGKEWVQVHDKKIEAIEDLLQELHGAPLLLAYEFRHELERLKAAFPYLKTFDGLDGKQAAELEQAWNNNEVSLLAVHPASIGHGLNLQKGGACHVAWMTAAIDYDLYDQLIRRLRRRGNTAGVVLNHLFLANDTVDTTLTLPGIRNKGITQDLLLSRLASELGVNPTAGKAVATQEHDMFKLGRQTAQPAQEVIPPTKAPAPAGRITPPGWDKNAANNAAPAEEARPAFGRRGPAGAAVAQVEQRQAIEQRLTHTEPAEQEPAEVTAAAQFDESTQQALGTAAPRTRSRKPKSEAAQADAYGNEVDAAADARRAAFDAKVEAAEAQRVAQAARMSALDLAIKYLALDAEADLMQVSDMFAAYIITGEKP